MSISLIPDSAPFNAEQRAWLNGFLSGWLGLQDGIPSTPGPDASPTPLTPRAEEFPWHDATLSIDERLKLAEDRPIERRLMAAMAQLDCGSCGYECQSYAEAIARGDEKSLSLCTPGGSETAKTLKNLMKAHAINPITKGHAAGTKPGIEAGWSRARPYSATLRRSVNLNRAGSSKSTHHVEIDLGDSGLSYTVGDALGVYPTNCPSLVRDVIGTLDLTGDELVSIESSGTTTLAEALLRHVCLGELSDSLFETLANSAASPGDAATLRRLADDDSAIPDYDVLELLRRFPGARPSAGNFVAALSPLKPRLYSISSSLKKHPRQVHLTVGRVIYQVNDRLHKGVASTMFTERLAAGDPVRVFVHNSRGFTVPADPAAPMIMVGPGTGIAPFRAFLEEREATGATGRNWLFFGDQKSDYDFLYEYELTRFVQRGLLTRLDTAFSRDQETKVYVQHRMIQQGADLFRWLEEGASVFVCGDAKRMAVDVHNALVEVVRSHGGLSQDEANAYIGRLTQRGRYHRDVY